jgi:hypothetical protein
MYYIYLIKKDEKPVYVGFTSLTIEERWKTHCKDAKKRHKKSKLYESIKKYGIHCFTIEKLYESEDYYHTLKYMEPHFIWLYKTYYVCDGYNLTLGGEGNSKLRIFSKKQRDKQYHLLNIDKIKKQRKQYRQNNKEKIKNQKKLYREKNKNIINNNKKEKYHKNKDEINKKRKLQYKLNKNKTIKSNEYEKFITSMPDNFDWEALKLYEKEDTTSGTQQFACTANSCELVDLTKP